MYYLLLQDWLQHRLPGTNFFINNSTQSLPLTMFRNCSYVWTGRHRFESCLVLSYLCRRTQSSRRGVHLTYMSRTQLRNYNHRSTFRKVHFSDSKRRPQSHIGTAKSRAPKFPPQSSTQCIDTTELTFAGNSYW